HNIKLLPKIPEIYKLPPRKARKLPLHHTVLHVFVGKGTPFEDGRTIRLKDDFPNGRSNTILIIEGGKPVPWTKPEDIPFDPALALPDLFNVFGEIVRVGFVDGSVRHLGRETSEQTVRAAITRNGTEMLGPEN